MTEVKKAVIPAAGLGTRFLPVTKSMPKEMLPVIDKPVIHYVVEEAVASGIDDIIIITGRGKRSVEDYFDDSPELEMHLRNNRKNDMLKVVRDVSSLVDIHYIRQKEPKGLGDAVLRAEKHINGEPFAVLLGDDIIRNERTCTEQLIEIFEKYGGSVIAVEEVPKERVSSYGIIRGRMLEENLYLVENIIEKPEVEAAPSNIGTVGRYIFNSEIFDCIKETSPGVGNEVQLTDAIKMLNGYQDVYACQFCGKRYDTGNKGEYVQAIIDLALEAEDIGEGVLNYMKRIVNNEGVGYWPRRVNFRH